MTEKPLARDYLLECLDPEVIRRPQVALHLRRTWRDGSFRVGSLLEDADDVDWEQDLVVEVESESDVRERTAVPERAVSEGFKKFVVAYFCIVLLRAIYKAMSGDDS